MDLHHIYTLILGGEIHTAPIKNPQSVLDIGTGTGIWAVEFAEYENDYFLCFLIALPATKEFKF
jgi:methylase of polypeptide subunit release factors